MREKTKNKESTMDNMAFELMEAENTVLEDYEDWENYEADMATDPYAPVDWIDYDIALHPWDYI